MPSISKRGSEMPASPIRKLVPYAEEAKKKGRKVYHLNIGQPDIKTPEIALQAVRQMENRIIEYSHSAGNESYRRKLADHYRRIGIDIEYTDILITTGGSEAVSFAFGSTIDYGEEIIIPEPFYANYNGFSIASGIKMIPVRSFIENDFALPPVEEFEKLITKKTRAIIICNPNNPTGYLYSREEILKLGEIVKKHDLFLISDEVYREFCYDGLEHFSIMNIEGLEQNTILIDSISKRYSACGARIGALLSRNKDVINTALKFAQARLSPPSFGQLAGEAALETPAEYFKEVHREYTERRNHLVEALNKMKGVKCPMPKGAFYVIAQLPVDDADKFAQWLLSDFEYNNQTVMVAPASGFYTTAGSGKQEVRIAYVLKTEDLKQALKCLEVALQEYPGRTT